MDTSAYLHNLGHGPGASLLIKQLRYIDAMKMLLADDPVDAAEALRIGLVNEVVPHVQAGRDDRPSDRQDAAGDAAHDERVRRPIRRSADRPGRAPAEPDQQSADPGDDRWGGGAPGLQQEAPTQFHRRGDAWEEPSEKDADRLDDAYRSG